MNETLIRLCMALLLVVDVVFLVFSIAVIFPISYGIELFLDEIVLRLTGKFISSKVDDWIIVVIPVILCAIVALVFSGILYIVAEVLK